jgi:hypothetical protein
MEYDLSKFSPETRKKVLEVMKRHGHNRWWESSDPIYVAKHQIFEDRLLVDFKLFHVGLEKLLGRSVFIHELGLNVRVLRKEANAAIARLEKGQLLERSRAEKSRKIREAIQQLKKTGKPVKVIRLKQSGLLESESDFLKSSVKRRKNLL